jgi:hypothetical protein
MKDSFDHFKQVEGGGRNPKAEVRNPKQIRSAKPESDFGFLSGFGFRNSGLAEWLALYARRNQ